VTLQVEYPGFSTADWHRISGWQFSGVFSEALNTTTCDQLSRVEPGRLSNRKGTGSFGAVGVNGCPAKLEEVTSGLEAGLAEARLGTSDGRDLCGICFYSPTTRQCSSRRSSFLNDTERRKLLRKIDAAVTRFRKAQAASSRLLPGIAKIWLRFC